MKKYSIGFLLFALLLAGTPALAATSYTENGANCLKHNPDKETFEQCITRIITRERAPVIKPSAELVYIDKKCNHMIARAANGSYSVAKTSKEKKLDFGTLFFNNRINQVAGENGEVKRRSVEFGIYRPTNKANFAVLEAGLSAEEAAATFSGICDKKSK